LYWGYTGYLSPFTADWTVSANSPQFDYNHPYLEQVKDEITYLYGTQVSKELTKGNWWFNSDDGYFYFIGVIEGAQSSPNLLTSLKLSDQVSEQLSSMKFSLTVNLDAIQTSGDALISGWNLDTSKTETGKLYQALIELCDE
jgi:hypothetical protein